MSEQERYKNTISPQRKSLLMSLDCVICTGHWQEKGKELDIAAEAHSSWMLQHLAWELWAAVSPRCPCTEPRRAPHSAASQCCLGRGPGCPETALRLQGDQEGRCPPCTVCGSTPALGIPAPSCLCATPKSRTPSSCGRTLLIIPQKHHRSVFQSHLLSSAC